MGNRSRIVLDRAMPLPIFVIQSQYGVKLNKTKLVKEEER
jgi:hypothetical protein